MSRKSDRHYNYNRSKQTVGGKTMNDSSNPLISFKRFGIMITTIALGMGFICPVGAEGTLEEIVVTAQFRAQNLQETPLAITAVSGDMLEARSQTSIIDVANQAPNVTLKPGSAPFGCG